MEKYITMKKINGAVNYMSILFLLALKKYFIYKHTIYLKLK